MVGSYLMKPFNSSCTNDLDIYLYYPMVVEVKHMQKKKKKKKAREKVHITTCDICIGVNAYDVYIREDKGCTSTVMKHA